MADSTPKRRKKAKRTQNPRGEKQTSGKGVAVKKAVTKGLPAAKRKKAPAARPSSRRAAPLGAKAVRAFGERRVGRSVDAAGCAECVYNTVVAWCGHDFDDYDATLRGLYAPAVCDKAALIQLCKLIQENCQRTVQPSSLTPTTTFGALRSLACGA